MNLELVNVTFGLPIQARNKGSILGDLISYIVILSKLTYVVWFSLSVILK